MSFATALLGLGGDIVNGIFNYNTTKSTNEANAANVAATNASNVAMNEANNASNERMASALNQQNMDIFNKQMDYTKAVQQQQYEREDSSYQRTVADLQASGLSPLAMSGTNGAGSVVAQPSAPDLSYATQQAARVQPFRADTPQFDMGSMADVALKSRELDLQEAKITNEKERSNLDRQERHDEQVKSLAQNQQQFEATLAQNKSIQDSKLAQDAQQFNASLAETVRSNSVDETQASQKIMLEKVKGLTNGYSTAYRAYDDDLEYNAAMTAWQSGYYKALNKIFSEPSRTSKSSGGSGGAKAFGFGASASGSGAESKDISQEQRERMAQWFNSHPVPIYTGGKREKKY